MRVTLVVGDTDRQRSDARRFHAALTSARHAADLVVVPEAGHVEIVIPRLPAGRATLRVVHTIARKTSR
jgi:acetyl esterase/lipase